jgi:rRNA processing protein Gar1
MLVKTEQEISHMKDRIIAVARILKSHEEQKLKPVIDGLLSSIGTLDYVLGRANDLEHLVRGIELDTTSTMDRLRPFSN